jgi:hypothetical protein
MKPSSVVHSDPDILGGAPVFIGTRVPLQALIDYLEGDTRSRSFSTTSRPFRGKWPLLLSNKQKPV